MGIDVFASWKGKTESDSTAQSASWLSTTSGSRGYLREAYHGGPYATEFLFVEAFEAERAQIPTAVLRDRLPHTLTIVAERERKLYRASEEQVAAVQQSFCDFVALCAAKEQETGEPVTISVWA